MKRRVLLIVLLTAVLTTAGCSNGAAISADNESIFSSKAAETETDTQTSTAAPEIAVTAPYSEEYEHMPLEEEPYQEPDVSDISRFFVHKKVGSGQDMELYLELLDKETDGLYCTVKNNKNVWRAVTLSVCDTNEEFDDYISTSEKFALAPNGEVVVKLGLDAGEYAKIDELSLMFFCNGLSYSADTQTANLKEKELDLSLGYFLYVYRFHEAHQQGAEDGVVIDLTENFIRGFETSFITSGSGED